MSDESLQSPPRVDFQAESEELLISIWATPNTRSVFTLPKSGGVTNEWGDSYTSHTSSTAGSEGEIIGSHTNYTKSLPVKRARLSVYNSHQRQCS